MCTHPLSPPAKALLVALVCAALVAAGAAPVREQGHDAAATAHPLARRSLRDINTNIAASADGNVTTNGLIEDVLEYAETAVESAADFVAGFFGGEVCLYGDNCGMNCEHYTYDEDDPLDTACYVHDTCLYAGIKTKCECDDELIRTADEIASWDEDSDMVRTAATVRDGIITLGKTVHGCYF